MALAGYLDLQGGDLLTLAEAGVTGRFRAIDRGVGTVMPTIIKAVLPGFNLLQQLPVTPDGAGLDAAWPLVGGWRAGCGGWRGRALGRWAWWPAGPWAGVFCGCFSILFPSLVATPPI